MLDIDQIAQRVGNFVMRKFVRPSLRNYVSFYRGRVYSPALNGRMGVVRPFDDTVLYLPYVGSAEGLAVGQQCVVLVFGGASNAVVLGDGTLSNL